MVRSVRFAFLLPIILCGPLAMSAQKAALDSVLVLLKQHPARDLGRLDLLSEVVRRYEFIHARRGMPLGDEAIALARSLGDERRLVIAIYRRAALEQSAATSVDRGKELAEAIAIGRRLGLRSELAWTLLRKGFNDFNQNGPDTNRTEFLEAARIFHGLGDAEGEGAALAFRSVDVRTADPAGRRDLYQQAERLLEKGRHTEWLVYCLQLQLLWHSWENRYEEAIACGERALALCSTTDYDMLIESTHAMLGSANKEAGNYRPAVEHFLVALRMSEALDLPGTGAASCLNLGPIFENLHDTTQAIAYLERGYHLAEQAGSPYLMGFALRGLGTIASERNDLPKALQHYEKALALCSSLSSTQGQAGIDQCEAESYINIGDAKQRMGNTLGAKAAYEAGLAAAARSDLAWEMTEGKMHLSDIILGIPDSLLRQAGFATGHDRDKRALELALQALGPVRAGGMTLLSKGVLASLAVGYERLNDPANALRYTKELMTVKDSLLDADKAKAISSLQIQYETEKKEQQIVLLGKDKEVQAKEIQKQKLVRNGFVGGFAFVALFAGVFFLQRNRIKKEHQRSEELLLNILPEEVAEELKDTGAAQAKHFDNATILFTDFKGFTQASETMSPQELVAELNTCFKAFDHIITSHGIEKIKTIGDAYMCAGGLPDPKSSSPSDVVFAALEMQVFMKTRKVECDAQSKPAFEMRLGIHTGPVVAGIVGVKKFQYDIWGDTVNTASRMESSGEVGQVNISEATHALVKNETDLTFTPRGKIQAKGKGEMEMYFVHGKTGSRP